MKYHGHTVKSHIFKIFTFSRYLYTWNHTMYIFPPQILSLRILICRVIMQLCASIIGLFFILSSIQLSGYTIAVYKLTFGGTFGLFSGLTVKNKPLCISLYMNIHFHLVFLSGSDGKESACNAGDLGLIPGSGRSLGEGNGNPLQYSCVENPMNRGAWRAPIHRGRKESDTTE